MISKLFYINQIKLFSTLKVHSRILSIYLFATFLNSFISILLNPFLAANLSPEDYAIIGYFTSFNSLILSIISLSLISYYLRNYYLLNEEKRALVLNTIIVAQLVFGLILFLIMLMGFYFYMLWAKVSFPFSPYAVIAFIPIFFSIFYNFLLAEKRMKKEPWSYFKIVLFNTILSAIFAILLVVIFKKGALGRLWSILIPGVIMGIYGINKLLTQWKLNRAILVDAIKFSFPLAITNMLYYFLYGIDRAMLVHLEDPTTFGIYNVAVQISAYLFLFYTAIMQTFEPDIFKTIAENNKKKLLRLITLIITINAIPTILFIIFAQPVVNILTYGRYTESVTYAQILAIRNIPLSLSFLTSTVIVGYGYPKVELITRIIGALISILVFQILIDHFEFYGAAWGQSISLLLMIVLSLPFVLYKILQK